MSRRRAAVLCAALAVLAAAPALAQNREAVRTRYQPPVYPENLAKTGQQGNVLLIGRIDTTGRIQDLRYVSSTNRAFVASAIEAVNAWEFRPATRDGKPIEIFANVAVRFRMEGANRGLIPIPILGDLAISPADASGRKTAPEGFPIRRGKDAALRAEVLLDVPPGAETSTLKVQVEAISPAGKKVPVFQPPVAVPAKAIEARFPVVVPVGKDWEEGVWILKFTVNGENAGGGQFWVAADPGTFRFVLPAL